MFRVLEVVTDVVADAANSLSSIDAIYMPRGRMTAKCRRAAALCFMSFVRVKSGVIDRQFLPIANGSFGRRGRQPALAKFFSRGA
jgi:hypothetical protein